MLVIRDAQLQALIAADDDEVREAVMDAVREANPARVAEYSDEKLGAMCDIAIARARLRQMAKTEDIAAFAAIMFETSPRFDEHPEIKAVLEDINLLPGDRLFQLFDRVSEAAWAVAEWSYDESEWFRSGN